MIKKVALTTVLILSVSLFFILGKEDKQAPQKVYSSTNNPAIEKCEEDDDDSIHVKNVFLMNIKHIIKFFRI